MTPPARIDGSLAPRLAAVTPRDMHGAERVSWVSTDDGVQAPVRARATWLELAILAGTAGWVLMLAFLRWPALVSPQFNSNSNIDAAFFALAGQLVRDGGVPYTTFWDHKPPLIYLIDAAAFTVSGGRVWGVWLASVAALLIALGAGYAAWRRMFGSAAAVVGAAAFAFSLAIVAPFNLTEGYALPIQAGAMLVLTHWVTTRGRVVGPAVMLGALGGLAFMLRPNLIVAPGVAVLAMLLTLVIMRRARAATVLTGAAAVGAAIVVGPVLFWLSRAGAFDAFVDQVFHYNFVYSATSWGARLRAAFDGVSATTMYATLVLPFLGWLVAAFRLRATRPTATQAPVLFFALLWLPLELVAASIPGRPYMHYFAMLLLPLATLTTIAVYEGLAIIGRGFEERRVQSWRAGAVVTLCMLIGIVPIGRTLIDARDSGLRGERAEQIDAAAEFVRTNSSSTDHVLVWGHAADVYLFADRAPASRFVYPLPLLTPGYADSALVAGFVDELRTTGPVLIIDATRNAPRSEALVPSLGSWNPKWQYPEDGVAWWTMTPALRQVYDYVASHYAPAEVVGPQRWQAYRLAASPRR